LPGTTTIPDQIAADKTPYYDALELADAAWKKTGRVDVTALESMLDTMLANQLLQAAKRRLQNRTDNGRKCVHRSLELATLLLPN
jgi:hypothetical protein